MSVKQIITVLIAAILLTGFIALGVQDAVKTNDKLKFQDVELNSKSAKIKELNVKYEKLIFELDKAAKDKAFTQEQYDKLKQELDKTEAEKKEFEAQLQAKLDKQNSIQLASTKAVNAATNTQVASASSGGSLESIIRQAAVKNGLDPDWFYGLAKCESTWNPNAVNYNYWEEHDGVKYYPSGLYQHLSNYWPARAAQYGYAGASVFDPVANANVTAAMWKSGSHLWECQ